MKSFMDTCRLVFVLMLLHVFSLLCLRRFPLKRARWPLFRYNWKSAQTFRINKWLDHWKIVNMLDFCSRLYWLRCYHPEIPMQNLHMLCFMFFSISRFSCPHHLFFYRIPLSFTCQPKYYTLLFLNLMLFSVMLFAIFNGNSRLSGRQLLIYVCAWAGA